MLEKKKEMDIEKLTEKCEKFINKFVNDASKKIEKAENVEWVVKQVANKFTKKEKDFLAAQFLVKETLERILSEKYSKEMEEDVMYR